MLEIYTSLPTKIHTLNYPISYLRWVHVW